MKKEEEFLKNEIEKESIALFKKNLLKESYKWFKDTDYFVKIKNDNNYNNIENKTETKNIVTGRVQLGWGGTFFLLCCVVVICDNSGWQSCNHYNNNIFYSPESLTIVYSFLYVIYAFPLFIFHQCLGLVSQGNYVKSCRMLSPHMGILTIFSLFGTITFCAKEICNFSAEFLQNIIRLYNISNEAKYGMTKIFVDLTTPGAECASAPNTIYMESINYCVAFNDNVIVNFYENLWFIGNKGNYIYLILISTLFILFCYFILLRENIRVFKFFIFVIIINWITTKSVVTMNTFFFYIPQSKKIYEEIISIFKEIGFLKLTIFLYGTLARSSSIFILSTFASYFHTNTNIMTISLYTFVFYMLNMYFYLKNEAHEYYLYNKGLGSGASFNFMKCNTYINMLQELKDNKGNIYNSGSSGSMYSVWQKLCLFFSSYSFLFSTVFIVLMQLLGPFNILTELAENYKYNLLNTGKKIYTYKSLVKIYEKSDFKNISNSNRSYASSYYSKKKSVKSASDYEMASQKKKKKKIFKNLNYFTTKPVKTITKNTESNITGKEKKEILIFNTEEGGYQTTDCAFSTNKGVNLKKKKEKKESKMDFYNASKSNNFFDNNNLKNSFSKKRQTNSSEYYCNGKENKNIEESIKDHNKKNENNMLYSKNESSNDENSCMISTSTSTSNRESSYYEWTDSDMSFGFMKNEKKDNNDWGMNKNKGYQIGKEQNNKTKNKNMNSSINEEYIVENKNKGMDIFRGNLFNRVINFISNIYNILLKKYGIFVLFFFIYIFTLMHIVDFKRNNNIVSEIILYNLYRSYLIFIIAAQIIYASWLFGMKMQMIQCGVISCLMNFITWIIILPLIFIIYSEKHTMIKLITIGIVLNIITIIISYIEVIKKIKTQEKLCTSHKNKHDEMLQKFNKIVILKKCLYWLYIGNLEILRTNLNIAMSGSEKKYIPFFWVVFFKYINSSMLIVIIIYNTKEYFFNMKDIFKATFSLKIELFSIFMIFFGSFWVLLRNIFKDHYMPQNIVIPSVPLGVHEKEKKKYIFPN
ncbi:conserved Plasmodium protein, unknown function [Plasmodium berghei]|uniref:Uncharacterized protein n=2 Tax=Plasmodium berghei TaxID=5821 RepID=A0A509ADF9_PLABA|nr:conserved Plasmodium protein, unknown function [Plasmodium berghei ANKA]CXI03428.1 conserved Plasmodium protein, unknown function [Plasmodium berghei]SCL92101.1 conserved Plasmodium protein, unknown function [Plasmodium berghei]SCM15595.1 conserved Plasmodium protein, unknown function [Plasmodium berghei]SCM17387.1 conserved Plasmodium protein, unknown function [Plasmodium berghei]SCN22647.1 conserved Plasmodium protein, unknown function [Plasmodium berghei]|eukprot:XP_034420193.1 conserved Plasmodium protein, unknown function [Plasmodium berghei ANKA]